MSCHEDVGEGHAMPQVGFSESWWNDAEAIDKLKKQVEDEPSNAELHYRLARLFFSSSDLETALTEINKALELESLNADYSLLKARILHRKGNLNEAISEAENAQSLEADDPSFYSFMSELYLEMDSLKLAEEYLNEANLMAGDWMPVVQAKARLSMAKGDLDGSIGYAKKALEQSNMDPSNYYLLGDAYLAAGRLDSAGQYIRRGLNLTDNADGSLLTLQAELLNRMGKTDSAIAVYQSVIGQNRNNKKAFKELADLLIRKGNFDAAEKTSAEFIRLYPADTAMYLQQGYCLERLGRLNQAQELYVKASVRFPDSKEISEAKDRINGRLTRTYISSPLE